MVSVSRIRARPVELAISAASCGDVFCAVTARITVSGSEVALMLGSSSLGVVVRRRSLITSCATRSVLTRSEMDFVCCWARRFTSYAETELRAGTGTTVLKYSVVRALYVGGTTALTASPAITPSTTQAATTYHFFRRSRR
jgi:hypothetical protein